MHPHEFGITVAAKPKPWTPEEPRADGGVLRIMKLIAEVEMNPFLRVSSLAWIAGTLLFAPRVDAQQTRVDRLLPADTLFAISVDDHEAYQASLANMPLTKIMADKEVQTFLEKPTEMIAGAIGKLRAEIQKQEGFENFELSFDDLTAGTYGRMFFALTHIAMPDPQAGRNFPDIGLVVGIEGKAGTPDWQGLVKDLIGRGAKNSGMELGFRPASKDGIDYEELVGGGTDRPPVLMAKAGKLQLFSLSHESLKAVMTQAMGGAAGKALADHAAYQLAQKNVGIDSPAATRVYINTNLGLRTLAEGIKLALAMENETEYVPLVDKILDKSGLLAMQSIAAASVAKDGVAWSRSWMGIQGERKGLLALAANSEIDLGILDLIPKNASSFGIMQADFGGFYDFVMDVVKTVDEEAHQEINGMIDGFGAQLGGDKPLSLRNDILGNIGPQIGFIQPQSSNPMMPSFLLMAQVKNEATVVGGLTKLLTFGSEMSQGEFSLKSSTYKDVEIHQIEVGAEMGMPIAPCFAVIDQQLCLSLSVGDLKRHIRRTERTEESSIKENEDFQRFFSKLPQEAKLQTLSYTDVKYSIESGYSSLVMALPMITMAADFELPIDMALLPTQETITEHLFGSLNYSMEKEGGVVSEGYGPFGGEVLGMLAGGAIGGLAVWGAQEMDSQSVSRVAPAPVPVEESPADQVRYDLSNLKAAITIYRLQNDQLPVALSDLLEPSEAYPQGCLGSDSIPQDPWGNTYRYQVRGSGYALWSIGANGTDDGGQGDDILVEKK